MTEPESGWLDKVQKLLAMAESTTNPAEAEVFSAKAEELMVKYSINEAMLQASGKKKEDRVISVRIDLQAPYATVKRDLVFSVARSLGTRAVHSGRWQQDPKDFWKKKRAHYMTVIGFESDVAKVEMLTASLFIQMSRAVMSGEAPREWWESANAAKTRTYRNAVAVGFTHSVALRLRNLKDKAKQEASSGTDLVLFNRDKRVEAEVNVMFPKLINVPAVQARSNAGYNAGRVAGDRADLGQPRMSTSGRKGVTA